MSNTTRTVDNGEVFYGKLYYVVMSEFHIMTIDAPDASAALDEAIDAAEAQGLVGLFLDDDDITEFEADGTLDDYVCGGNHGRYLSSLNAGRVTFKGYATVAA